MDIKATEIIRKRYDRIAPLYDTMEFIAELAGYKKWRKLLWEKVEGKKILEVGWAPVKTSTIILINQT